MLFTLGLLKNDHQCLIKSFNSDGTLENKIVPLESISDQNIQGLIFDSNSENSSIDSIIEEEIKFFPFGDNQTFKLDEQTFENLDFQEGLKLLKTLQTPWLMHKNLGLLENLFPTLTHLKTLLKDDRTSFFEELWFVLKSNLGASDLTILYNDLKETKKENEKRGLVRVKIDGTRLPRPVPLEEIDEKILEHYKSEMGPSFNICEYDDSKGQLVFTASIFDSPILIMTNIYQINRLQKALLGTLFEGL